MNLVQTCKSVKFWHYLILFLQVYQRLQEQGQWSCWGRCFLSWEEGFLPFFVVVKLLIYCWVNSVHWTLNSVHWTQLNVSSHEKKILRRGGWLKVLIYCWVNISLRVPSQEKKVQAENLYLRVKPIQGGASSALPQHFSFSDFDFQSLFFQSVFFQFVFFNVIIFESETNPGGSWQCIAL